jgi:hypothetical protein
LAGLAPVVEFARGRRLGAPLLLVVWGLLGFEAIGGLVIFVARLVVGTTPGEALHVIAGVMLTGAYAIYQWRHWTRVRPFRPQFHYALGLIAALSMALVNLTGLWLGVCWWQDRIAVPTSGPVRYPPLLSAGHNVASMLVLAFVGAHLGAVLFRDRTR